MMISRLSGGWAGLLSPLFLLNSTVVAGPQGGAVIDLEQVGVTQPGYYVYGIGDTTPNSVGGAGDLNGDGIADLILGFAYADPYSQNPSDDAGQAFAVFGKAHGDVMIHDSSFVSDAAGFRIDGAWQNAHTGFSVSGIGDVNGDGLMDLGVGATGGFSSPSRCYVIFGRVNGDPVKLNTFDDSLGTAGFRINEASVEDETGRSVAGIGDVNGDGLADLIVGAPYGELSPSMEDTGRAYVIFGKTDGEEINLGDIGGIGNLDGFLVEGALEDDNAGWAVSGLGDVNGDGLGDFAVGVPGASGTSHRGEVHVVFGKSDTSTIDLLDLQDPGNTLGFRVLGYADSWDFGDDVSAVGDVNGDGLADVLVSDKFSVGGIGHERAAGVAFVIFGKGDGGSVSVIDVGTPGNTQGYFMLGENIGDQFGAGLSGAGDVNGDGLADVLVGAPESGAGVDAGPDHCYLVLGKADSQTIYAADIGAAGNTQGWRLDADSGSRSPVAGLGDVNGDGLPDVALSIGGGLSWPVMRGRCCVLFSPANPPASATYLSNAPAGVTTPTGVGIKGDGSDASSPDARLYYAFDDGAGPSRQTVTITRNDGGLGGALDLEYIADVQWLLETDRTAWTGAEVAVKYTDAEIANIPESGLTLLEGYPPTRSFAPVADFKLDTARNEASGTITQSPTILVLQGKLARAVATIHRIGGSPTTGQVFSWTVNFERSVSGLGTEDVLPGGTLSPAVETVTVAGSGASYIVTAALANGASSGTLGFSLPYGAASDGDGAPTNPATAPEFVYEPIEPAFTGDMNDDGLIDVADVEMLVQLILGGPPAP